MDPSNTTPTAPNSPNPANIGIRILVVEDDQFLRDFYHELLAGEGFTVDVAADGEVALQKMVQGGWNLILLDIMLPKKDGLQILRDLKVTPPAVPNGPIVALTNLGHDAVINQAFDLGANGYLIKSAMNPDDVLSEIQSFLKKPQPKVK
ncbi:MAG: response regulator [bacterium]|nr:response regulator [bacterium]